MRCKLHKKYEESFNLLDKKLSNQKSEAVFDRIIALIISAQIGKREVHFEEIK